MLKISLVVNAILIALLITIYISWGDSREKIKAAEKDREEYMNNYYAVVHKGDSLNTVIWQLQQKETGIKVHIDSLEVVIVKLEQENRNKKVVLANLFQPDELVDQMRAAYPELKTTPLGIAEVPHPRTGFLITTFQLPVHFVTTFLSDHGEVENYKKQISALGEIKLTYENFLELKDSIIVLNEQKAQEYRKGLDDGRKQYDEVVKKYITALEKPPKIEWPSTASIIGAGAVGVLAGFLINK